jgi:hypothetical protein
MTERLLEFLDDLARTGGARWYPLTSVSEAEQPKFQDEVEDLRAIAARGYINIRSEIQENMSGSRNIVQVMVEMLDGEGWLEARQGDH